MAGDRPALARRIRQTAAGSLFPPEQARPAGWLLALITVGCAALAGARQGWIGLNTIWAEDGLVFYQGALAHPWHAFLQPWGGYWETTPRILAVAVALVPIGSAAGAIAVADAIVMGLLAALVYRACGEHIRNPWLRAIPAIATAVCPVGQEICGTIANLQWPMYFAGMIVLLWNPRRPLPITVGTVTVVLLTLTSPFGLLLAPLAVTRIAVLGRGRDSMIPLALLVGTVTQSTGMAILHGRQVYSVMQVVTIGKLYEEHVAGQGFFGIRIDLPSEAPQGAAVVIAMLTALVFVTASGRLRQATLAALALTCSVGYFAVLLVVNGNYEEDHYPGRYDVVPFLLLVYAVTVLLDSLLPRSERQWATWLHGAAQRPCLEDVLRFVPLLTCAALIICLAWSVAASWQVPNSARQRPTWPAALANGRATCGHGARTARIPITPRWPRHYWHVTLPCADLTSGKK